MKFAIKRMLRQAGYELTRIGLNRRPTAPSGSRDFTNLLEFVERAASIRGMATDESCKMLYALCYQQLQSGDVAEIGSWQGKSTSFLARAVKDSRNGRLHAVDHFRGNKGKAKFYRANRDDLADLEGIFWQNLRLLGLDDVVTLHNLSASAAAPGIKDQSLRFLFLDGDHTAQGVQSDLRQFWPKLRRGAVIAFDDYSTTFPGVTDTVHQLLKAISVERAFAYRNSFVLTLPVHERVPKLPPLSPTPYEVTE